jgi:hypothetical protein
MSCSSRGCSASRRRSALRAHPARLVLRGCVSELVVVEAVLDHEFMLDGSGRTAKRETDALQKFLWTADLAAPAGARCGSKSLLKAIF